MRAHMTRTRTATSNHSLGILGAGSLLALALLLSSWASTSQAYGPGLDIANFQGNDLGYYDMYEFSGKVINTQDPASLTVYIYYNGNLAGSTQPDINGDFAVILMCPGAEVTAECTDMFSTATATITIQ